MSYFNKNDLHDQVAVKTLTSQTSMNPVTSMRSAESWLTSEALTELDFRRMPTVINSVVACKDAYEVCRTIVLSKFVSTPTPSSSEIAETLSETGQTQHLCDQIIHAEA